MKRRTTLPLWGLACLGAGLAGCVHTPPGTSVEVALAKRPEVVRYPTPPPAAKPAQMASSGNAAGEPALPDEKTERVADAYSRGEFCMKTGNTQEAISAFQEVVKLDPKFSQAWNNLAALYEMEGKQDEALKAFRKSKMQ